MNIVPNSDSEQCIESKLSRVPNAPTYGPSCAQATRALRRVVARWAVSWPPPRPCRACALPCRCEHASAGALCRAQDNVVSQPFRPYRAPPAPHRGACSTVSQRYCTPFRSLSHDTPNSQVTLLSRYKNCIVTQLELNQDTARYPPITTQNLCHDTKPHAVRARPCHAQGLVVSQPSCTVSWSYCGRAWPYRGRAPPYRGCVLPSHARLLRTPCHDAIYCIVTQHKEKMGSIPFQPPLHLFFLFFFFHSFFFHFVPPTGRPQKKKKKKLYIYIYIYIFFFFFFFHFPIGPNKFIRI